VRTGLDDPEPDGGGGDGPDDGDPEELADWVATGFGAEEAEVWRRWRIPIARARAWLSAGVGDGLRAAQWSTAGVTPHSVRAWYDAGIEATEAVRWHELGFDLTTARTERRKGVAPEQAYNQAQTGRFAGLTSTSGFPSGSSGAVLSSFGPGGPRDLFQRFRAAGIDPRLVHGYMQNQWFDDDALAWAAQGIEAYDAYTWHDLGLAPPEAGRLAAQGRSPGEVIREWWRAGIPFDEVADWIGAGLSAHEAVDQRGKGITAEQAAALRALRQDDEPAPRTGRPLASVPHRGPPRAGPTGPPPEDEDTARARIGEAFAGMLTPDETLVAVPTVEDGSSLGPCLTQAGDRFGASGPVTSTVTVDAIQFVNDHEARVSYTVEVSGGFDTRLADRIGRAVLVAKVWMVARETFCDFIRMAGVECPPRGGASRSSGTSTPD